MRLIEWLTLAKAQVQALFGLPHIPPPKGSPRPGLIPQKKTVRRGGKTHVQTYYVRPDRVAPRKDPMPGKPARDKRETPPLLALLEEAARRLEPPAPKQERRAPAPAEPPPLFALLEGPAPSSPAPREGLAPSPTAPKEEGRALQKPAPPPAPSIPEEAREALEEAQKTWKLLEELRQKGKTRITYPAEDFTISPPPSPEEAFRKIADLALSHHRGYRVHPDLADLETTHYYERQSISGENDTPPLFVAWGRLARAKARSSNSWWDHYVVGEDWVRSVLGEIKDRAQRAQESLKRLARVKTWESKWREEHSLHYLLSQLGSWLRIYEDAQTARAALQLGDPYELAERIFSEARSRVARRADEVEKLAWAGWEKLSPSLERALEALLGGRYVQAGGPIGGAIRALGELLEDPEIKRRPTLYQPYRERLEELERKAHQALHFLRHPPRNLDELARAYSAAWELEKIAHGRIFPPPYETNYTWTVYPRLEKEVKGIMAEAEAALDRPWGAVLDAIVDVRSVRKKWPFQDLQDAPSLFLLMRRLNEKAPRVRELLESPQKSMAKAIAALEGLLAKAETRNIPVSRLRWVDRPRERKKVPASHFLLPKERKFPYRNKDGSINCRLLKAAISRAAQHGYSEVEKKARRLYQRHCAKE